MVKLNLPIFQKKYDGHLGFYKQLFQWRDYPFITIEEAKRYRKKLTSIYKEYLQENNKAYYIDPLLAVCDKKKCSAVVDGDLIYSDSSPHINKKGSIFLIDFWNKTLKDYLHNDLSILKN